MGLQPQILWSGDASGLSRDDFQVLFAAVRARTMDLGAPLSGEDQCIQSMPDVSPTKWHKAHTTWFFETFILKSFAAGYEEFHPDYNFLFNSYYEAVGPRHERPKRGLLSRPPLEDIHAYRRHVDAAMETLIADADDGAWAKIIPLLELGLNHEQQHQELILTDIKHVLSCNPLGPAYQAFKPHGVDSAAALTWIEFSEGLFEIGHDGDSFAFDNEGPRHKVWQNGFRMASRPVSNGEFLEFIHDGGYGRAEFWLSDGWATVQENHWRAPLYWQQDEAVEEEDWQMTTLSGLRSVDAAEPVCHVSFFEADAYAKWAGKRLPSEAEWERFATECAPEGTPEGNFADQGHFHPVPAKDGGQQARQVFGDVWEWTQSAYAPYPGYRAVSGAVGEYNGKFMSGQMVLRGGSAATPKGHVRPTYRNFFHPPDRWQFSGLRLAEDV